MLFFSAMTLFPGQGDIHPLQYYQSPTGMSSDMRRKYGYIFFFWYKKLNYNLGTTQERDKHLIF